MSKFIGFTGCYGGLRGRDNMSEAYGTYHLQDFIKSPTFFITLSFHGMTISDEDCVKLAMVLKGNNTVSTITLDCNQIGDQGAIALADAIKGHKSLIELHINNNYISAKAQALLRDSWPVPSNFCAQYPGLYLGFQHPVESNPSFLKVKAFKEATEQATKEKAEQEAAEKALLEAQQEAAEQVAKEKGILEAKQRAEQEAAENVLLKAKLQEAEEKLAAIAKAKQEKQEAKAAKAAAEQAALEAQQKAIMEAEQKLAKEKAKHFEQSGDIYEAQGQHQMALASYLTALKLDKALPETYEKVGELLFNDHNYAGALKYFKIISNTIKVSECFEELIKQNPKDAGLRLEKGDYYLSIGLHEKAVVYYKQAFSLSKDADFKANVLQKQSNAMKDHSQKLAIKAQDLGHQAENKDFYNFDAFKFDDLEGYQLSVTGDDAGLGAIL